MIYAPWNVKDRPKIYTPQGEDLVVEYEYLPQLDGTLLKSKKMEYSRREQVESYRASTDIHTLLKHCEAIDDYSALVQTTDLVYGDLTDAPKTYQEALDTARKIYDFYGSLPDETRAGMTIDEFVNSLDPRGFGPKVEVKQDAEILEKSSNPSE